MEPGITILPIGNAWTAKAIRLILPIQQGEFHLPTTVEGQPDLADIDRFYHGSGGGFWGALIDGRLVGTIGLISIGGRGQDGEDRQAMMGVIRKMFVHKDYRGSPFSIAQRLLETLIGHARNAGIRDIFLGTIDTMEAAARFYERNGFIRVPRTRLPASFPLMAVDNTFYHLRLGEAIRSGNTIDGSGIPGSSIDGFGIPGNTIDGSGILAIATRLLRLSDRLRKDAGEIYQAAGIVFEPKWFPVIYVLDRRSPLTVMDIAGEIGYTHPSTISLLQQLEKAKLVRSARDRTDSRKRLVHLTPKCRELIGRMKPVWQAMTIALTNLTDTPHPLLPALDEIERQLQKESFLEKVRGLL